MNMEFQIPSREEYYRKENPSVSLQMSFKRSDSEIIINVFSSPTDPRWFETLASIMENDRFAEKRPIKIDFPEFCEIQCLCYKKGYDLPQTIIRRPVGNVRATFEFLRSEEEGALRPTKSPTFRDLVIQAQKYQSAS
ncbi:MAG: hypothetical protein HQM08_06235 [Candidatus Riflebacteria bacterium]|nr:hypothetical protein [Candidatus Riflebacteria bacterium]